MTEDDLICSLYRTRRILRWLIWFCVLWPVVLIVALYCRWSETCMAPVVLMEIIALAAGAGVWCYRAWLLKQNPDL